MRTKLVLTNCQSRVRTRRAVGRRLFSHGICKLDAIRPLDNNGNNGRGHFVGREYRSFRIDHFIQRHEGLSSAGGGKRAHPLWYPLSRDRTKMVRPREQREFCGVVRALVTPRRPGEALLCSTRNTGSKARAEDSLLSPCSNNEGITARRKRSV